MSHGYDTGEHLSRLRISGSNDIQNSFGTHKKRPRGEPGPEENHPTKRGILNMNIMPVDDTGVGICPRCQVEPKVWPGCTRSTEDDMWICWKCVGDENWLMFHLGQPVQQPSEWPVVRQPLDPRWTVIKLRGLIKYEPDLAGVVLGLLEGRLGQLPTAPSEPSVGDWDRIPFPTTLAEVLQQLRDRIDDIRFGYGDVPAAQELLDRFDEIIGWPSTRTGGGDVL